MDEVKKVNSELEKMKADTHHDLEKAINNMSENFVKYKDMADKLAGQKKEIDEKIDFLTEENTLLSNLLIATYDILKSNEEYVSKIPALKGLFFEYKELLDGREKIEQPTDTITPGSEEHQHPSK